MSKWLKREREFNMWQRMNKNVTTNEREHTFYELEYGTEGEGIRVTITIPKPVRDLEFTQSIHQKINTLRDLTFFNHPERFTDPISQGFRIVYESVLDDNPNGESKAILSARPILLLKAMEQVYDVFGIRLNAENKAVLNAINAPDIVNLRKRARTVLLFSTEETDRPSKYSLMPENPAQAEFYGMRLNNRLPENLSKVPEELTFNTFSYKKHPAPREVISSLFADLATADGITLVSTMPLADSAICGGEHFPYLVENYHALKDQGVEKFAILVPDIMDSVYRWAQEIIKKASWVMNNPTLRDSPTLVEDHFVIIADPTRKIGNYLGVMEPHQRGVFVPHRASFVLGGDGLVLASVKHENPTFCRKDKDPKEEPAPIALLEVIAKGKQEHDRVLRQFQAPRAVRSM